MKAKGSGVAKAKVRGVARAGGGFAHAKGRAAGLFGGRVLCSAGVVSAALAIALAAASPAFAGQAGVGALRTPCMQACAQAVCQGIGVMAPCAAGAWCAQEGCAGFVDADDDGVCDNRASGAVCVRGEGSASVAGSQAVSPCAACRGADAGECAVCDGRSAAAGSRFVDADDNGVCDNREECTDGAAGEPSAAGRGFGAGCGMRACAEGESACGPAAKEDACAMRGI